MNLLVYLLVSVYAVSVVHGECKDNHNNCGDWAATGECQKNPGYMLQNCKESCLQCGNCKDIKSTNKCKKDKRKGKCTKGNNKIKCAKTCGFCAQECKDNHKNCGDWAATGECQKNPGYMLQNCKESCNQCGSTTNPTCPANPTRNPSTASPPYHGTIFNFPNIITASDPTSYTGITYAGKGSRRMYDGRNGWIDVNPYLFTATFSDHSNVEFRCNPEYDYSDAYNQASKYANALGRIPEIFRSRVDIFDLNRGTSAQGGRAGGNFHRRSMSLSTDYGSEQEAKGIIEELFIHEGAHASLDGHHANAREWICAENDDGKFISTYSRDNPEREDVAESVLPWLAVAFRSNLIGQNDVDTIRRTIPNRIAYFDKNLSVVFPK